MSNLIQREPEMEEVKRQHSFMISSQDTIDDGTCTPIRSPDTIVTMTVLLVACLALAVLAHAVI